MGAAVHDVAQALGGGYSYSQHAGEVATIVKLSRVALLAPAVALIGLGNWQRRRQAEGSCGEVEAPMVHSRPFLPLSRSTRS